MRNQIQPLVSITMITHNHKDDAARSIEEIHKITYPNWEMIVTDNDSTDGLPEMIKTNYPRIQLMELHENRPFYARKLSFERAGGKYIIMLDDDSYPEPDAIGKMVERFEQDPCLGIIAFNIPCGNLFTTAPWPESSVARDIIFLACGAGIKKELFLKLGSHWADETMELYCDERDFAFRAHAAGYTLGHFKDIVAHHRQRDGDQKRNNRFSYLTARNRLYLMGKYIRPRFWPAFYLRNLFYGSMKIYYQLGWQCSLWNFLGNTFGAHYIWEGYRKRTSLPSFIEHMVRHSFNFARVPIKNFLTRQIVRKNMLNFFQTEQRNHQFCYPNSNSAAIEYSDTTEQLSRKILFQIARKFFITRSRPSEDITVINHFLALEIRQFEKKFRSEILQNQDTQAWLKKLEKDLAP